MGHHPGLAAAVTFPERELIDFADLAAGLLQRADALVAAWLPGGTVKGHEYVCADLGGGEGGSLSVNLVTGVWADFSGDERGGDLISLYAAIHNLNQGQAARALMAELERLGPDDADAVPLLGQRALLELFEVPASASGMEMASRAISLGDATGTPAQRARLGLGFTRCVFGAPNWSELLETALAESEVADDIPVAWWAREALVVGTIFSGQVAEARAMADEGAALVGTHRYLKRQRLFETYSAIAALFLGRYGDVLTGTARLLRSPCDTRTLELVKLARALALIDVGADASAVVTTQACEKVYRAGSGRADVDVALDELASSETYAAFKPSGSTRISDVRCHQD